MADAMCVVFTFHSCIEKGEFFFFKVVIDYYEWQKSNLSCGRINNNLPHMIYCKSIIKNVMDVVLLYLIKRFSCSSLWVTWLLSVKWADDACLVIQHITQILRGKERMPY